MGAAVAGGTGGFLRDPWDTSTGDDGVGHFGHRAMTVDALTGGVRMAKAAVALGRGAGVAVVAGDRTAAREGLVGVESMHRLGHVQTGGAGSALPKGRTPVTSRTEYGR